MAGAMRVICPLSACSSSEKRDQFLAMLSNIAAVTLDNEPKTVAYAWFTSSGDNDEVPSYWVRGLEVYEDEAALAEIHRSSAPYKRMRSSVLPEKILSKATDLRFLEPAGIGFLSRERETVVFSSTTDTEQIPESVIVVHEIKPRPGMKPDLLGRLSSLAEHVWKAEVGILTFWVLQYLAEYEDDGVVLFSRFLSNAAHQSYENSPWIAEERAKIQNSTQSVRTTRWKDSGIGFIRGETRIPGG